MHEAFIDDRLDKDMVDIRKIMKADGTNPIFKVEFKRNSNNDIVMSISAETNSMPSTNIVVKSVNQIGQELIEYIAETSTWV